MVTQIPSVRYAPVAVPPFDEPLQRPLRVRALRSSAAAAAGTAAGPAITASGRKLAMRYLNNIVVDILRLFEFCLIFGL